LPDVTIFVSGGLDEDSLIAFARAGAPIDGIGIGTAMTTSSDVPAIDCVYKLQEYAGIARRKRSANKATWPGRKQVWRRHGADGRMADDILALEGHDKAGEPLLHLVMQNGRRLQPAESLDAIRARVKRELERLPEPLRRLESGMTYPVEVADELKKLAAEVDRRTRQSKP
jgi:nicotinate phosphoribosyltransferase